MSELPKGWDYQQIASFIPDKKGAVKIGPFGSQLKSDEMVESGIKVLGQENIIANDFSLGERYISEAKYEKLKSCTVFPGDILVSMMGTIGLSREVPANYQTAIMDSHLLRIQVDSTKVCKDYFCKVLHEYQDIKSQLHRMSQGGIMSGLNSQIIHSLKFPIPPLNEQKKIAEILTSVDKVIELTEVEIEKLKNLKKGMMQDLLTKGIGHTKFKDSPIGKIPKEWSVEKLANIAKVKGGKRLPKGEVFSDFKTSFPYLRVTDFKDMTVKDGQIKYLTEAQFNRLKNYRISKDDLYITVAGVNLGEIGTIPEKYDQANLTENADKIIINNPAKVHKEFLKYFLNGEYIQNEIGQEKGTGGGVPKLALHRIESFFIVIPNIKEQITISENINAVERNIATKETKYKKLIEVKKGLMQDLLTGKVRVKV